VFDVKLIHGGDAFGPWPFGTAHTYTEPTAGVVVLYLLSPRGNVVQSSVPDDVVALGHV
jgi:hypothetical protein